jgi:hypothetical protein
MTDYLPIPRKFKPGHEITLDDLIWARKIAAKMVAVEPATLPLFQRIDREVIAFENKLADIERAKMFAKNGIQNE